MPLCSNCGKDNREGAKFCQSCGTPLTPQQVPKTQGQSGPRVKKSTSEIASGATCGSCGTLNAPGMKFCKMCGSPLETLQGQPAKTSCPSCGGETPTGYKFCQHCGTPIAATPAPSQAAPAPDPTPTPDPAPAPPGASPVATGVVPRTMIPTSPPGVALGEPDIAKTMIPTSAPGVAPGEPEMAKTIIDMEAASKSQAATSASPSQTPAQTPNRASVSGAIQSGSATPPSGMSPADPAVVTPESGQPDVNRATLGPGAKRVCASDVVQHAREPLGRLVSVNRDGSDGEVHSILEESVDLGRTQGQLRFGDDPYLSDRHCRFYIKNNSWIVRDLGSTNGVYVRVTQPCEVEDGDYLLLGKQVVRLEYLSEQERDLTPAVEHGVLIFGSPLRTPWCRLKQFTVAGIARDIHHLYRTKVTIGREDGDIIYPDDEFMSRRHLTLTMLGGKAKVEDLGSSNGTFIRIRDRLDLVPGAMIRIGDQLLRFERA